METTNKFKTDFKYYKQKCPLPDFSKVLDFSNIKEETGLKRLHADISGKFVERDNEEAFVAGLMIPPSEWVMYEVLDKPGLLFIKNPFNAIGQRYWIYRCLRDYTRRPNRLNIDAHHILNKSNEWWDSCQGDDEHSKSLNRKLRWATMGYHHNWDTKVYSEDMKDQFPTDLADLSRYVGRIIGFQDDFSAEAAIVNFYHFDSTLSGHTDHSEMNMTAPLFSFSFGQTAIFLLGGPSLDVAPTAMYIKSGDIVIMSGHSRKCYHGIPKIVPSKEAPWNMDNISPLADCNFHSRTSEENEEFSPNPPCKRSRVESSVQSEIIQNLSCEKFWKPFCRYIEHSRINMNVRQVLFKGDKALDNKGT
ncbi:nucleic acid dioxygenase ALKBH1 isoform X2 [Thrips palmi]|uniref:Nucleic acid dioxygenase ALKBH1 isoform X2 n=1 Tax=Thrips palmi TaxID=161013 RepID=A0A6P9A9Z0_THRPL|nr:nucleic acid dioxygenase ALKBH1 isoform X2 [Thrips palmi]